MVLASWVMFALLSALFTSFLNITRKKALFKEHTLEFNAILSIFVFLFSLVFVTKVNLDIPLWLFGVIFILAIFASCGMLLISKGYRHMPISVVDPLLNINPIFILFLAFLFLGERITGMQLGGVVLIVFGAYILEADHNFGNLRSNLLHMVKSKYTRYVIIGVMFFAVSATLDKFILSEMAKFIPVENAPFTLLVVVWGFIALIFSLLLSIRFNWHKGIEHGLSVSGKWIILCAFLAVLATFFYYKTLTLTLVSLAIPIKRLSTFFSTVIGGRLFHEKGLFLKGIACLVMISGAVLMIF